MRLLVENSKGLYRMLDESLYTAQLDVAFQKGTHKELAQQLTDALAADEAGRDDGPHCGKIRP